MTRFLDWLDRLLGPCMLLEFNMQPGERLSVRQPYNPPLVLKVRPSMRGKS